MKPRLRGMSELFLDRENSATIGFVVACAFTGVIDQSEIRAWADHVLVSAERYPLYVVDLSTFEGPLNHIYQIVGFAPHSGLSDKERDALVGIGFLRGRQQFEPEPTGEQALAALAAHPQVLARFRDTLPCIAVPDQSQFLASWETGT